MWSLKNHLEELLDKEDKELLEKISRDDFDYTIVQPDYDEMWQGMPEFENEDNGPYKSIIVHFDNEHDVSSFAQIVNQNITEKTKYIWFPKKENMDMINYRSIG